MTTTTSKRFQFRTRHDEQRLVIATGNFRQLPRREPDGIQVGFTVRGSELPGTMVNIGREEWLDGCRYLVATGVIPIAELALPCSELAEDLDPGKLADTYSRQTVELAQQSGLVEAPSNHAVWGHLRRFTAQGFLVGWFAARRNP
jgi:hypothetical protein